MNTSFRFRSIDHWESRTCGITTDSLAYCWESGVPTQATNGRFTSIAVGSSWNCAIAADSTAFCWGGLFGPGAVPVSTTVKFTALAGGTNFHCGLTSLGTAYCWGDQTLAPLLAQGLMPTPVPGAPAFARLADHGQFHMCGITAGGDAYCWGTGNSGRLGHGSNTSSSTPVRVLLSRPTAVISGGYQHTCAITIDGEAFCWGLGNLLGDGTNFGPSNYGVARVRGPT